MTVSMVTCIPNHLHRTYVTFLLTAVEWEERYDYVISRINIIVSIGCIQCRDEKYSNCTIKNIIAKNNHTEFLWCTGTKRSYSNNNE